MGPQSSMTDVLTRKGDTQGEHHHVTRVAEIRATHEEAEEPHGQLTNTKSKKGGILPVGFRDAVTLRFCGESSCSRNVTQHIPVVLGHLVCGALLQLL